MICITKDHKNIFFEVLGNLEANTTIVLLNGLSQTTQSWGLVTPRLLDTRIIVLDFIFQGRSDHTSDVRTFDTHASDVLCVLESLHCDDAILVGLSYGSLVAQHFAYNYPDKLSKMVLLSTFAHKTPYYESIETAWSRSLEIGGYSLMFDVMMPFVLSDNYFSHPLIPIEVMKNMRQELMDVGALKKLMQATAQRKDFRNELRSVKTETLVIQGEKDVLFPVYLAEEVVSSLQNGRLIVLNGLGHTLNLEGVDIVCKEIRSFAGLSN